MENNLREIREKRHLSIRDVEKGTGINRGKLSEIENGIRKPTYDQRLQLNTFFDEEIKFWIKLPVILD